MPKETKPTGKETIFDNLELEDTPGYHKRVIPRGQVGELSKVLEEALEAMDAEEQGVSLMVLIELSDLLGAVKAYLTNNFPDITLDDLEKMSEVTVRAFKSGRRS